MEAWADKLPVFDRPALVIWRYKTVSKLLADNHACHGACCALSEGTADFCSEAPAIANSEIAAEFDTKGIA